LLVFLEQFFFFGSQMMRKLLFDVAVWGIMPKRRSMQAGKGLVLTMHCTISHSADILRDLVAKEGCR
jgi:hypothetical protein